jgi:hypothetical protein
MKYQYQFYVDDEAVGPVRTTWNDAIADARDNGYSRFADAAMESQHNFSEIGPSIKLIVLPSPPYPPIDHARNKSETEAQRENRVAPDQDPVEIAIAEEHAAHANLRQHPGVIPTPQTIAADEEYARRALKPNIG